MGYGLILLALMAPSLVHGTERILKTPTAHFLFQDKSDCHFANGTAGEVRYIYRQMYDRQECLHFDSRLGLYQAIAELCKVDVDAFNRDPQLLASQRARVDIYCRHNYGVAQVGQVVGRTVQPTVKISITKADRLAHHTLLICTATGYYPQEASIKWLKNGQEQTVGVGYADEVQNGDWTFQYQVMLETVTARGDVYTCQVEHKSLKEPITVQWEPQTSDSAQSKVWTGTVGAVLGLVFLAVGLYLYLKSRKAAALPPPTGLLS